MGAHSFTYRQKTIMADFGRLVWSVKNYFFQNLSCYTSLEAEFNADYFLQKNCGPKIYSWASKSKKLMTILRKKMKFLVFDYL